MIIRTFTADSIANAMKQVRRQFGSDALILRTRKSHDNRLASTQVEITACIDRATDAIAPGARAIAPENQNAEPATHRWRQHSVAAPEWDADPRRFILNEHLRSLDLPREILDRIEQTCSERRAPEDVQTAAETALAGLVEPLISSDLSFKAGDSALFIGPAGGGRSTALTKLAVELVAERHMRVALSLCEVSKIGAHDELQGLAELLEVEFLSTPQARKARRHRECVTLIDGPAISAGTNISDLRAKVNDLAPSHCLAVIPADLRSADVSDLCNSLSKLNPTHLIACKTDLTYRLGGVVLASLKLGAPIARISDSAIGINNLLTPASDLLARHMMTGGALHD